MDDFGARVQALRKALGLTQHDVAARAIEGVPNPPDLKSFSNHLSRIERGRETNPSMELLERLAAGMGLTLAEFFAQIDGPKSATLPALASAEGPSPSGTSAVPRSAASSAEAFGSETGRAILFTVARIAESLEKLTDLYATRQQARTPRPHPASSRARRRKAG